MLQTFAPYILIYLLTIFFAYRAQAVTTKKNKPLDSSLHFYIAAISFALIVGLRWNVGIDYPAYYDLIMGNHTYDSELGRLELIPRLSIAIISENGYQFYLWFIFMAFIQIFFLLKAFKGDLKVFVIWGVFFYLTNHLEHSMNIIRQEAAMSIILYAYTLLTNGKVKQYVGWILFASLFHFSSIICLPFVFLRKVQLKLPVYAQLMIYALIFIYGNDIISFILDTLLGGFGNFSYISKLEAIENDEFDIQSGSGLGVLFINFKYILLILFSRTLSKEYRQQGFDIIYTITFIGMCFYRVSMNNQILSRIMMFFTIGFIICYAMMLMYIATKTNKAIGIPFAIGLVMAEIIIVLFKIYTGEPYQFIWDVPNLNL